MCCAVAFSGAFLAGCSGEDKQSNSHACADCEKAGAGHMCAACQKQMWAESSKKCEACKKLGEGHMCDACQKHCCDMHASKACEMCKKEGFQAINKPFFGLDIVKMIDGRKQSASAV